MQALVEQQLMSVAAKVEEQVDNEMHRLNNLDGEDIEKLRGDRIKQMKKAAEKRAEWIAKGHGEYREIYTEKEFFAEMKNERRMVCHFFRDNWPCKVMDKHLQALTQKHIETKFVKINAEKAPFLVDRLKIWMLPTLAVVKNEKTTDYIVGFDELGGVDEFPTEVLAMRLGAAGAIEYKEGEEYGTAGYSNKAMLGGNVREQRMSAIRKGGAARDEDDEDSDFD